MAPKRVALNKIKSLTFESGLQTEARRTDPIPQLQCRGKACKRYQPDVVQCQNMGDDGSGSIQWKCDADLPKGMRFGRVEVSCEGWTRAGDTNVLPGSCGLTYELTTLDPSLDSEYGTEYGTGGYGSGRSSTDEILSTIAQVIALVTTAWVVFNILRNLFNYFTRPSPGPGHGHGPGHGGGGPGGGGGGGGGGDGPGFGGGAPPPPYTKQPPTDIPTPYPPGAPQDQRGTGPGVGFWTGLAAGTTATFLLGRREREREREQPSPTLRERGRGRVDWDDMGSDRDRAVGPSTGGDGGMRRATAFGSSSTR